jgi:hypothetical protein
MPITLGILAQSRQAVAAGDYELIESVVLGSTTASVTFSGLAAYASTYKHLQLRIVGRTNRASVTDDLSIRLNADTGSNYRWHYLTGNGSSVSSADIGSNTFMGNYTLAGNNVTANTFSGHVTDILDAFSSNKNTTIRSLGGLAGSYSEIGLTSGAWFNTASITQIQVFLRLGSSYLSGTRFSLYGIRG